MLRDLHQPGRSVVMSTRGMVATSQPMATAAGLEILRRGGNAMDAAVAAVATQCVTEPFSTGIGGDCFILYHEAKSGKLFGLNGSGRAPAKVTAEDIRRRGHDVMPEKGILPVTVPGAIHGWETGLNRFGTMGLEEVLQAAIGYAENGYAVSPVVARVWERTQPVLAQYPDSRNTLLVGGKAPAVGTLHRQPNLARSLRQIGSGGAEAFYKGWIAERIVEFSKQQDGLFELDDFANHESEWVEPISTEYRGVRLCEIPPNGQGITALMTLNILEQAGLGELERLSAEHVHLVSEAFSLAMAERDRFVADPDFSPTPLDELLSKSFAQRQRSRINPEQALQHPVDSGLPVHKDTVYLTVVDEDRNAVSFINSLFESFGSGLVAGETGIVLHNRGWSFNLQEGHANCIEGGKRPMHTIIPAMAYRDDKPLLSFGVMGGHYQAMGHAYVLSNWLDFGLDLQQAIDAPRFLPEEGGLTVERGIASSVRERLQGWGHRLADTDAPLGGGQAILIDEDNGVLQAASDARKDGCALGF